jgi:hypothetical protein
MTQSTENNELFSKKNPFKVPEGYFENFAESVMQKIENETQLAPKISMWKTWGSRIAVAASIIIVTTLSFSIYQFTKNPKTINTNIATISVIADTTDAELSFVDENHIVDVMTSNTSESSYTTESKVEGDDIIDYLVDDVDENLIAEAY